MIDASAIAEIIATYKKYDWVLRRVLLTESADKKLGKDKPSLFGDAVISDSDIDAAWFSRPPKEGGVGWEIRYLGDVPYALLENVDEGDGEFETTLQRIESRLRESVAKARNDSV